MMTNIEAISHNKSKLMSGASRDLMLLGFYDSWNNHLEAVIAGLEARMSGLAEERTRLKALLP